MSLAAHQNLLWAGRRHALKKRRKVAQVKLKMLLWPSLGYPWHFLYHFRGQNSGLVSALLDKYSRSSFFNWSINSRLKKGNATRHSVSDDVGCILFSFWGEKRRAALNAAKASFNSQLDFSALAWLGFLPITSTCLPLLRLVLSQSLLSLLCCFRSAAGSFSRVPPLNPLLFVVCS